MHTWEKTSSEIILKKKIFNITDHECFHKGLNKNHTFTIINSPNWVNIAAITEDGNIILIRQHRLGNDELTLEIPAGLIEAGEDPQKAAIRELEEETGYKAGNIVLMNKLYSNPAIMDNLIFFYYAENCFKISDQNLDPSEDIQIELFPLSKLDELLNSGQITHQIIYNALLMLKDKIK